MNQNTVYNIFKQQEACNELKTWLQDHSQRSILIEGLFSSAKAFAISSCIERGVHLIVLNNREDAAYCSNDLNALIGKERVFYFPAVKGRREAGKNSSELVQRTTAIQALNNSLNNDTHEALILVTYPESILETITQRENIHSSVVKVSKGDKLSHEFVIEALIEFGFERNDFVSEPGQFSVRGSLIDLFSYSDNRPYRIDFCGDEIESIRSFDVKTQLTIEELNTIEIYPDIFKEDGMVGRSNIFEFIGEEAVIWLIDYAGVEKNVLKKIEEYKRVYFYLGDESLRVDKRVFFHTTPQPAFNKNFELLFKNIREREREGYFVTIFSESNSQIERLNNIFSSISEEKPIKFTVADFSIHEGFVDHNSKICIYTDHQIFDRYHRVKTNRSVDKSEMLTINEINSFQIGDYVVHIDHGVGIFGGLVKTNMNGRQQEAIKLIYKDGDIIFVSIHGLHRISKYKSKDSTAPKVYKLGTGVWLKLKRQTKSKVKDIAKELIHLYARRKETSGFAFSADSYMQYELESSFMYEDTPDQYKASKAVKEDMERSYPMDRLICGDVGFGKTEIAIRAAFKAVTDSKQVAIMVPTTILALQHFKTFSERLKDFPCTIEYISRLKSTKQINEIADNLSKGKVDIVIGTHRLLNRNILFKDLGLLIIDEEQKFGVAAKERLRELKLNVDTLTLSATPIPRTLQFSLLGARDMSIINTPPPNRLPVQTQIIGFDEEEIRDAINFEVERGGQVFFVHNRVEDIRSVEDIIRRLCPSIKTCIGHGQMDPVELERVILDFMMGDYDLLLSTTIVENGIDIPNANTMIINQAQNFGLSDLHQLRGRVGRSNKKAFCYLIVPSLLSITDDARRRVKAVEAFSDLGSGFNIAMQDLDIRGAGNLLGGEQSGFIAEMGFETYQRILQEAFLELNEEVEDLVQNSSSGVYISDCQIDTDLEILIPDDYINITAEKIRLYKEIDSISEEAELERFLYSVSDRFGPLPEQVKQLAYTVRLRKLAINMGFEKIVLKNGVMIAYFVSNQKSDYYKTEKFSMILEFLQRQAGLFRLKEQNEKLYITVKEVNSIERAYNIFKDIDTACNRSKS